MNDKAITSTKTYRRIFLTNTVTLYNYLAIIIVISDLCIHYMFSLGLSGDLNSLGYGLQECINHTCAEPLSCFFLQIVSVELLYY